MNKKPKYELGQTVRVRFFGEVEGVKVVLYRLVYVIFIGFGSSGYQSPFVYRVADRMPKRNGPTCKVWDLDETQLEPVDDAADAIARANGDVLPASATAEAK